MKNLFRLFCLLLSISVTAKTPTLNYNAICFYYNWYGNVATDGQIHHWAHPVMPQNDKDTTKQSFPGNGNIGADYYPLAGEYSSADPKVIDKQMQEIAAAGIGVVAVTWLGQNDYTYKSVPLILDAANKYGIKICFQIEPVVRKTALTTPAAFVFLITKFGKHPAFYHHPVTGLPMFFVYDSYVIKAADWADVLTEQGKHTIRYTAYDASVIGLWVEKNEQPFFLSSGFDGFYTYFAAAGFTYGSTPANWASMQQWADVHHKIFIPSVGPGYCDNRIRPWNKVNTRPRDKGAYYDAMFQSALDSKVHMIGITSFNEWHEGTQIEPAKPYHFGSFIYQDYQPMAPDFYLQRTKYWLDRFGK